MEKVTNYVISFGKRYKEALQNFPKAIKTNWQNTTVIGRMTTFNENLFEAAGNSIKCAKDEMVGYVAHHTALGRMYVHDEKYTQALVNAQGADEITSSVPRKQYPAYPANQEWIKAGLELTNK